jgi:hypothetical protein
MRQRRTQPDAATTAIVLSPSTRIALVDGRWHRQSRATSMVWETVSSSETMGVALQDAARAALESAIRRGTSDGKPTMLDELAARVAAAEREVVAEFRKVANLTRA